MKECDQMKYQSAKVYVFDFHFDADSKIEISREKERLDKFFDKLKSVLQNDTLCAEVFLRKH